MTATEDQLRDWVRSELVTLWWNLRREERLSLVRDGKWSLAQESVGERIKTATELVGPVDWREIPVPLLASGWFTQMNARLGTEMVLPTDEELAKTVERYHQHLCGSPSNQ